MTTTSTQVGISGEEKPTSRVLRPPGGGSSNIFGFAEDDKPTPQRKQQISNVFGGNDEVQQPQRSRPQAQNNIFGEADESPSARQQRQKPAQGEEFPAYDVSIYAAQMTPQRRNINRVSTHNPITGAVNPGCDDTPIENAKTGRRHVSNSSVDAASAHNPITGEVNPGCDDSPLEITKTGRRHILLSSTISVSTHNPITGEANPGYENSDETSVQNIQKGRRNIGAFNPITGEPVGNESGEGDSKKVHTSSRVTNPPGGKSTALW